MKTREVEIAQPAGDLLVFVTELSDARGRLVSVCESRSSARAGACDGGGLLTTYTYDFLG